MAQSEPMISHHWSFKNPLENFLTIAFMLTKEYNTINHFTHKEMTARREVNEKNTRFYSARDC